MRKTKSISIKSHPDFYNLMERYRRQLKERGINASQSDLTKMIAMNLNKKRRGLGLMSNEKTNKR